jgi:hypothetical protein
MPRLMMILAGECHRDIRCPLSANKSRLGGDPFAGCGRYLERQPTGSLSRHDAWPHDQDRPYRRSCGSPA